MSNRTLAKPQNIADLKVRRLANPAFIDHELSDRRKYPRSLVIDDHLALRYRRSRRESIGGAKLLRQRQIFAWIEFRGDTVGALELYEYSGSPELASDEFAMFMDGESSIQNELAETLLENWDCPCEMIFERGTLLDFRNVWIDPTRCPPSRWAFAAEALIGVEFAKHVLLMLKAFPLEHAGQHGGSGVEFIGRCQSRQRAMMRLYQRLLGVASIDAESEWMWRAPDSEFWPMTASQGEPHGG